VGGAGGSGGGGGGGGGVDEPDRIRPHFRYICCEVDTVACTVGDVVYCVLVSWAKPSSTCAMHLVRLLRPALSSWLLYSVFGNALPDDFALK
jgi:hypothetical protein